MVSIHAPREGCDSQAAISSKRSQCFNSRTPGGVRLHLVIKPTADNKFQFTHPGRGATTLIKCNYYATYCFNSRTPGGVRPLSSVTFICASMFQFTHPGRGATRKLSLHSWSRSFNSRTPGGVRLFQRGDSVLSERFNSRTPGGVRPLKRMREQNDFAVSIHAPREGCDYRFNPFRLLAYQFQFTHPGRGATAKMTLTEIQREVSIHAPREGCDWWRATYLTTFPCFNSRTPGGVRLY
mgnify:CR=1 FL=1